MLRERGGALAFSHLPASLPTGQDLGAYFKHLWLTRRDKASVEALRLRDADRELRRLQYSWAGLKPDNHTPRRRIRILSATMAPWLRARRCVNC